MSEETILTLILLGLGTILIAFQAWRIVPYSKSELQALREEFSDMGKEFSPLIALVDSSAGRCIRRVLPIISLNAIYAAATFLLKEFPGAVWGAIALMLAESALVYAVKWLGAKRTYPVDLYHARRIKERFQE